jgi:hypothetical protein
MVDPGIQSILALSAINTVTTYLAGPTHTYIHAAYGTRLALLIRHRVFAVSMCLTESATPQSQAISMLLAHNA